MRELINGYTQVVENIHRYNEDLPDFPHLQDILSNHRDCYYLPSLRAFGPSKFIGYIDMTGLRYTNYGEEEGSFHGGYCQKALSEFFVLADDKAANGLGLYSQLKSLQYRYGKRPRSNVRFYLPKSFTKL
jgi:hypothetical protein